MNNPAHLLPASASPAEVAQSCAMARLANLAPQCREMWRPATCPSSHLPWLAWAFSVDEWDIHWTDAQKRAVMAAAFEVHQIKGTVGALRTALDALGYTIELLEWYQETPPATPYTFGLTAELGTGAIEAERWDEVTTTALAAKNVRSPLRYVRLRKSIQGRLYVAGTTVAIEQVTVQSHQLTQQTTTTTLTVAAATVCHDFTTLTPQVH